MKAEYLIKKLSLVEHPEGGYFRETYKSDLQFMLQEFGGVRNAATAIYYLLKSGQFSAFHRMKSDEMWHFYTGSTLALHIIEGNGSFKTIYLGEDLSKQQSFQAVIKAGDWFAASVTTSRSYCLVGCTVAPGFEYSDWESGERDSLIKKYPEHKKIIEKYTR